MAGVILSPLDHPAVFFRLEWSALGLFFRLRSESAGCWSIRGLALPLTASGLGVRAVTVLRGSCHAVALQS